MMKRVTPVVAPRRQRLRPARFEALEQRLLLSLNPTGAEQYMLELINAMRQDPAAMLERMIDRINPIRSPDADVHAAVTFFNVNGPVLAAQWAALVAAPPLAWHEALQDAATAHSQLMIQFDEQSHQLPGEATLGNRIADAGYANRQSVGENVFAFAKSVFHGHAGFAIDWGEGPDGIQNPPGHRNSIMNAGFREIGISVIADNNNANEVGPLVVTQNFGNRFNFGNPYLLGVVYDDADEDGFYGSGEGLGGVTVRIEGTGGDFQTITMDAGGYQLQVPAGTYTVTFSGPGLTAALSFGGVVIAAANVKLDATNDDAPRVTIVASDPDADEAGDGGAFTITRTGDTSAELVVNLTIAGSAVNGADYALIDSTVVIAAGSASAIVNVAPLQDEIIEGEETVIITLAIGEGYLVAHPSSATVTIQDDDGRLMHFGGKTKAQYLDANGDTVTVTLSGPGSGQVILPPGNAATRADALEIILDDTTLASKLTIAAKGGDGATAVTDITVNGSLNSLQGKTTRLGGDLLIAGSARSVLLGEVAEQHLISIGPPPDAKAAVKLQFGRITDATIVSLTPIAALTVIDWRDTDDEADTITAPRLGKLAVKGDRKAGVAGDFAAGITLTDDTAKLTLGSAAVSGAISGGTWNVDGHAGRIRAAAIAADWVSVFSGDVAGLAVRQDGAGQLTARSVKAVAIGGDYADAVLTLTRAVDPLDLKAKLKALGKLTVKGRMQDVTLRSAGHVGAITAGMMFDTTIFAGMRGDLAGVPDGEGDFDVMATITGVKIKGVKTEAVWMGNSTIAAFGLGKLDTGFAPPPGQNAPVSVAARQIRSFAYKDAQWKVKAGKPEQFALLPEIDNLLVRVI